MQRKNSIWAWTMEKTIGLEKTNMQNPCSEKNMTKTFAHIMNSWKYWQVSVKPMLLHWKNNKIQHYWKNLLEKTISLEQHDGKSLKSSRAGKIGKIQFWEKTFWKNTDKHKMQEKMNKIQFWKKHPGKKCKHNQKNAILEKTFWKNTDKHKMQEKMNKIQFWKNILA